MKKITVWTIIGGLVLIFGLSSFAFSQITVTTSDAPSELGIYFVMGSANTVEVNLGEPGENKVWDFSNIPLTAEEYWRVVDFGSTPFAHRFPTGNLAYKVVKSVQDTTFITYNYARLTDTELTQLGRGTKKIVDADTTTIEISVAKRTKPQLNLPATFGDPEWSSVVVVDTTYLGFGVTVIDSSNNKIDAWGTMKTQFGEFPCLRVRQNHYRIAQSIFINLPLEINVNYFWVTNNYGILATVTGMSDVTNPNPDPNYTTAKSIDIMTNFLTLVNNFARGEIPNEFKLFQNYPNPFNPKTTFSYQLNEPSDVTLRIFNLNGQEVALLVRDRQQPGRYQFNWNASHLPSGIYYYQIQANQNLLTQKCLLLK